jgi:hypothetical protein
MLLISLGSLIQPSLLKGSGSQFAETERVGDICSKRNSTGKANTRQPASTAGTLPAPGQYPVPQ